MPIETNLAAHALIRLNSQKEYVDYWLESTERYAHANHFPAMVNDPQWQHSDNADHAPDKISDQVTVIRDALQIAGSRLHKADGQTLRRPDELEGVLAYYPEKLELTQPLSTEHFATLAKAVAATNAIVKFADTASKLTSWDDPDDRQRIGGLSSYALATQPLRLLAEIPEVAAKIAELDQAKTAGNSGYAATHGSRPSTGVGGIGRS